MFELYSSLVVCTGGNEGEEETKGTIGEEGGALTTPGLYTL